VNITLSSTTKIVELSAGGDKMQARIWEGHTDSGIPVHCYVTRIAVADDGETDHSQFERELQEHQAPSPAVAAIPLHLIL
jgi:hypothetical protein